MALVLVAFRLKGWGINMATITGLTNFPTANQNPVNSIMDRFDKQTYLGNAFIFGQQSVSLGTTAETDLATLACPVGSTKSIFVVLRRVSSSAQQVLFAYYVAPTITSAGTVATPVNLRPASSNASIASVHTGPTVSSEGTLFSTLGCPSNFYVISDAETMIILDPGQVLLITGQALTATTSINYEISWYEL